MINAKGESQRPELRIIVSGIGTGGHFFPAIVVAKELIKRKVDVVFLVRKGHFEEEVARRNGLMTFAVNPRGFYGRSIFNKVLSICSTIYSLMLLRAVTKRAVSIAFGGFGALPLVLSCLINRRPFYLFEPNRIPGRATKLFAPKAKKVFVGLPIITELKGNLVVTGIPIRQGFKTPPKRSVAKDDYEKKVLFVGGSQGAKTLNLLALEMQEILSKKSQIVIICGKRDYEFVNGKHNGRTKVIPFTFSLWEEIEDANVIISRAGALGGYEILCMNKPVIFIPFPYAVDNHQCYNAEYFAEVGNAVVVEEKALSKELLARKIEEMLHKRAKKKPGIIIDAEKRIADIVLKENQL